MTTNSDAYIPFAGDLIGRGLLAFGTKLHDTRQGFFRFVLVFHGAHNSPFMATMYISTSINLLPPLTHPHPIETTSV